jgi:hypothetical protein
MKMEAVCSSETLVPTYQTTRWYNPESHNMNVHSNKALNKIKMSLVPMNHDKKLHMGTEAGLHFGTSWR